MHVDPAPYKIEGEKRQWIMTIKGPMPKWSLLPIDSAASPILYTVTESIKLLFLLHSTFKI